MTWQPPVDTGGGTIKGYLLQICHVTKTSDCSNSNSADWVLPFKYPTETQWIGRGTSKNVFSTNDPLIGGPKQTFVLKRLISGQLYYVRLKAKNDGDYVSSMSLIIDAQSDKYDDFL